MKLRLTEDEQYPCYTAHVPDGTTGDWEVVVEVDEATAARWLRVQQEGDKVNREICDAYWRARQTRKGVTE